jgi:hypothetical protein
MPSNIEIAIDAASHLRPVAIAVGAGTAGAFGAEIVDAGKQLLATLRRKGRIDLDGIPIEAELVTAIESELVDPDFRIDVNKFINAARLTVVNNTTTITNNSSGGPIFTGPISPSGGVTIINPTGSVTIERTD